MGIAGLFGKQAAKVSEKKEDKVSDAGKKGGKKRTAAAAAAVNEDSEPKASVPPAASATKNTLILFEEVDVLRGEDRGFIAAIATLLHAAKRPVVLTSNATRELS